MNSNAFTILVLTGVVFVTSRSMTVLNRCYDRRTRERMSPLEMSGNPLLSRFYDAVSRALVRGKDAFERLLDNDHLGLRHDQIGITRRSLPIG